MNRNAGVHRRQRSFDWFRSVSRPGGHRICTPINGPQRTRHTARSGSHIMRITTAVFGLNARSSRSSRNWLKCGKVKAPARATSTPRIHGWPVDASISGRSQWSELASIFHSLRCFWTSSSRGGDQHQKTCPSVLRAFICSKKQSCSIRLRLPC